VALDRLSLDLLSRALDQTGDLVAGIEPGQAALRTPCPEFDVRALVNHAVYDLRTFNTMLTGGQRESADRDLIGEDWSAAYRAAADELMATWRARGTDGTLKSQMGELPLKWAVGQHLADIAVHGWDIARATGQSDSLDPEIGEVGLDWGRANLKPEYRGQAFGPEQPTDPEAPIYARLAGFFGRNPNWK
jgi:uncharacterized protein (TIGR03086 family)